MAVVLLYADASTGDDTETNPCVNALAYATLAEPSARALPRTPCWLSSANGDFCGDLPAGYEFPPGVLPSLDDSQSV